MSLNKKRSRKSKLEIRVIDTEETENTILQTVSSQHVDSSSKCLDHTYARQGDDLTPSSSGLQLSIKVEVEEFDETLIKDTKSPNTAPSNSSAKSIHIFEVNHEKIYKISDHINWSSTNLADKYLSIELKNTWGRVLKSEEDNDPYTVAVQKAFQAWASMPGFRWKESPLFYQCLICQTAWWHLTPFTEHIRIHDHTTLNVNAIENGQEYHIVATNNTVMATLVYLPCEGNCYRCGNAYNFHIRKPKETYNCKKCLNSFEICAWLLQHHCLSYGIKEVGEIIKNQCKLCLARFCSDVELDLHMITSHEVRSDTPVPACLKTCNFCQKSYLSYLTHMCLKSSLGSSCKYCYRKFHTKTFLAMHEETREENYKCKICDVVLAAKCMETEHMLTHTENYRMAYKCINYTCPSTILFPDERSIKQHKVIYHKQKFDKRRTYYGKVLIPEQCFKTNYVQVIDGSAAEQGIRIKKIPEPEVPYWYVRNYVANNETKKPTEDKNVVTITKQEAKDEVRTIERDSQDDSQDVQMDYAEMLSKVFKMSDTVREPRLESGGEILTQIKTEPFDTDFEDINNEIIDLVSVKQEPMDPSFAETCQTDICQIYDTYHSNSLDVAQKSSDINDSCQRLNTQTDCHLNIQDVRIKTEPEEDIDVVYDTDMTADVKMEPEDIKQEILECTEMNEYTSGNFINAESILDLPEVKAIKKRKRFKNNPNSLLKNTAEIVKFKISPKSFKTLLKRNFAKAKKKYSDTIVLDSDAKKSDSDAKKSDSDANETDSDIKQTDSGSKKSPKSKIKTSKYDKYGNKLDKLYKCAKCGYTDKHKQFRIHQNSFCEESPSQDKHSQFVCSKCDTSFGSLKTYLVHFTKHGYKVLHCPCCNVKFEMLKELLPHFHRHVKQNYVNCWMINDEKVMTKKQHRCQTCRQVVPLKELFSHWEAHLKLKTEKTAPEMPVTSFATDSVVNKKELLPASLHLALHQLRADTREKDCLICYRKFSRRYDVKRHIIEHLLMDAYTKRDTSPGLKLRCQICLEEYLRAEQYKFHMREHGGLPVYRCDLCDKTFSDSSNFAKHKKIHNMRVLICDICHKKFQTKISLEKHIIMHMTTEPIKCELCTRQFYSASRYNKHVNMVHTRPIQFRCVVCDMSFDSCKKKWDHAWAVHRERKQKADCPVCQKEFRRYIDVKNHAKVDHQLELSFYNIKAEGVVNNVNMFCRLEKNKKMRRIVRGRADTNKKRGL